MCSEGLLQAFFIRNAEFLAALLAATRQHLAAIFRSHPAAETMFVFTRTAGRLVGKFHRLSKKIMSNGKKWSAKVAVFLQIQILILNTTNFFAPAPPRIPYRLTTFGQLKI